MDTQEIEREFSIDIRNVDSLDELRRVKAKYLGKKGKLSILLKSLGSIPPEDRPKVGKLANDLKEHILQVIYQKERELKDKMVGTSGEGIDYTVPGRIPRWGGLHPLSIVKAKVLDIFTSMGFSLCEGPEIELDFYNFEALNIPRNHPARDMQDTFYISDNVLLRTHTTPVDVRIMKKKKPPLRIISIGKVYRRDSDLTHSPMFHQIEGLMVDEGLSLSDLKGILFEFARRIFGRDLRVRFRPSFFPFTEPSLEMDVECVVCGGKGCRVCQNTGWLEVLGSGLLHRHVFESVGYDPGKYTGLAFGMGLERITMLMYGLGELRTLFENDLYFLRQFGGGMGT